MALGVAILEKSWQESPNNRTAFQHQKAQTLVYSSLLCVRHGLLHFIILHRLNFTKNKLCKVSTSICNSCGQSPALLASPVILRYLGKPVDPNPLRALVGIKCSAVVLASF